MCSSRDSSLEGGRTLVSAMTRSGPSNRTCESGTTVLGEFEAPSALAMLGLRLSMYGKIFEAPLKNCYLNLKPNRNIRAGTWWGSKFDDLQK